MRRWNTVRPDDVILSPGDLHFGPGEHAVHTLLGSCVAVILWHPEARIGGMCHFLLPGRSSPVQPGIAALDGRFADEAMAMFRQRIDRAGTRPADYQAKIFGGGNQFPGLLDASSIDVGGRNVEAALALCGRHGLDVTVSHLGQHGSRRVVLDLASGDVWMKHTAATLGPVAR